MNHSGSSMLVLLGVALIHQTCWVTKAQTQSESHNLNQQLPDFLSQVCVTKYCCIIKHSDLKVFLKNAGSYLGTKHQSIHIEQTGNIRPFTNSFGQNGSKVFLWAVRNVCYHKELFEKLHLVKNLQKNSRNVTD